MPTKNKLLLTVATAATVLGGASATQVAPFTMDFPYRNLVATSTPPHIAYGFTPLALAATETFTITHSAQRYATNGAVVCSIQSADMGTSGTITCAASGSTTGTILTCTLDTDAVVAAELNVVVCASNISPNPAAGAQTTTMVTTKDADASAAATTTYTAVVSGQCSGNAVSATDLAKASVDASAQANAEGVKPPTGLYEFECGAGHMLKANPETITLSGADANAKKAVCCDARAGKCAGNAVTATDLAQETDPPGEFQFECGEGYMLRASPETITLSGADADAKKAVCCIAAGTAEPSSADVVGKCSGNTATATDLAEEADDETFQFACGDGKTLKPSASQITGKTIDACCDDASSGGQQPSFPACETDKVGTYSKALGAEGATYVEQCMCTGASATAVSACSAGSTCSSKATTADTVCSCTPSATTICYEMKSTAEGLEGKIMQMMSFRPGCFDIGTVMSMKVGCAATGTDAQMQLFKGKGCAAGSEYTDAEAKAAMGEDATSIMPFPSAWVVNKNEATLSQRYSSTCYGGVQHADSTAAAAAETAAAAPAPGPSGELSLGSSTSVGFAAVVLVAAAALANFL